MFGLWADYYYFQIYKHGLCDNFYLLNTLHQFLFKKNGDYYYYSVFAPIFIKLLVRRKSLTKMGIWCMIAMTVVQSL